MYYIARDYISYILCSIYYKLYIIYYMLYIIYCILYIIYYRLYIILYYLIAFGLSATVPFNRIALGCHWKDI